MLGGAQTLKLVTTSATLKISAQKLILTLRTGSPPSGHIGESVGLEQLRYVGDRLEGCALVIGQVANSAPKGPTIRRTTGAFANEGA